jgi:hypothetical protein
MTDGITFDPGAADFNQAVDQMDAKLAELEAAIQRGDVKDPTTLKLAADLRYAVDQYRRDDTPLS